MDDPREAHGRPYDLLNLPLSFADIADRSRRLLLDWLARNGFAVTQAAIADPLNIASSFLDLTAKMIANPAKLMRAQMSLWQDYLELWQSATQRMLGYEAPSPAEAGADPRFRDEIWEENNVFNFVKQSYLLTSRWIDQTVRDVDGIDARTRETVKFYTRQFVGALSPTNFALTNPEVIRATIETRGENLLAGLRNLLQDLERVQSMLWSDKGGGAPPFEVARTVAVTPGKVVYRNALMEVIQYTPTTRQVYRRPLLFIPAWINKYYLLDLGPGNSLVRWALDQGHTVFMISWADPAGALATKTFEDYVLEGTLEALAVVRRATGASQVDAVGYCLGGTLLAATLAYLASRGQSPIATGTFITSMLDFSQPGELGAFVDEATISCLDGTAGEVDDGKAAACAAMFNLLRENDLVWSFVVNNYLLGRDSFPYDLLYWNADAMRMPLALHGYYLRTFYQQNRLIEPDGIRIGGESIDLRRIRVPTYVLAAREDHLAPWRSVFRTTQLVGGPSRFVLAASGHLAGVVNPPAPRKYCHWTSVRSHASAEEWLATAMQTEGSWWPDWQSWLVRQGENRERTRARRPGDGRLAVLAEAPGEYVRMRA